MGNGAILPLALPWTRPNSGAVSPPPLTSRSGGTRRILSFEHIFIVPIWFTILLTSVHVSNILIVILRLRLGLGLRFRLCFIHWLFLQLQAFQSPGRQSWGLLLLRKDGVDQSNFHPPGAASLKPPNGGLLLRHPRPHHHHPTTSTLYPSLHLIASPRNPDFYPSSFLDLLPYPLTQNTYQEVIGGKCKGCEEREMESKSDSLNDQENIEAKTHCWEFHR